MRAFHLWLSGLLVAGLAAPFAQGVDPGRQTFVTRCASCHGTDGNGGELGPSIAARVAARTDQELAAVIHDGSPASGMPAFPAIAGPEQAELTRFLRTLKPRDSFAPTRAKLALAAGGELEGLVLNQSASDLQLLGDDRRIHLLRKDGARYRPVTTQADWPSYNGLTNGSRYSTLTQIDKTSVSRLAPKWVFSLRNTTNLQTTPLVMEGVMYVTSANECYALDAGSGRPIWHYQRPRTKGLIGTSAGGANRGVAAGADRVFMVTDHGHLIALNRFRTIRRSRAGSAWRRLDAMATRSSAAVSPSPTTSSLSRMGYGAMQLAGPGVFGPPRDRAEAIAVLREAVDAGITHIDTATSTARTSPTRSSARRCTPTPRTCGSSPRSARGAAPTAAWNRRPSPEELRAAVHENLEHLGSTSLDVVNLRVARRGPRRRARSPSRSACSPSCGSRGSSATSGSAPSPPRRSTEARAVAPVVTVQNHYNLVAPRRRRAGRHAARRRASPTSRTSRSAASRPLQSECSTTVAARLGATPQQVALAWLLQRSPTIAADPRDVVAGAPAGEPRRGRPRAPARRGGRARRHLSPPGPAPLRGRPGSRHARPVTSPRPSPVPTSGSRPSASRRAGRRPTRRRRGR